MICGTISFGDHVITFKVINDMADYSVCDAITGKSETLLDIRSKYFFQALIAAIDPECAEYVSAEHAIGDIRWIPY